MIECDEHLLCTTSDLQVPGLKQDPNGYWLDVFLYADLDTMQRAIAEYEDEPVDPNVGGSFRFETDYEDPKQLGVMFLAKDNLTLDVIAHECVHVAVTLAQKVFRSSKWNPLRLKVGDSDEHEELIAYTAGPLTEHIHARFLPHIIPAEPREAAA